MRMLKLLMLFCRGKGHMYIRGIISQTLVVLYQRRHTLPQWKMLQAGVSTFNEEAGEISFSCLGRACLGDTQRDNAEHMNKLYVLIKAYAQVEDELEADIASERNEASWRKKLKPDSEEVRATEEFILGQFRLIRAKKLQMYDGTVESFKNAAHAHENMRAHVSPHKEYWVEDTTHWLSVHIEKQAELLQSNWCAQHCDIWPEFKVPEPDNVAVDLELAGSEAEDSDKSRQSMDSRAYSEEEKGGDAEEEPVQPVKPVQNGGVFRPRKPNKLVVSSTDESSDSGDESEVDEDDNVSVRSDVTQGKRISNINTSNIIQGGRNQRRSRASRAAASDFPIVLYGNKGHSTRKKQCL